MYFVGVPLLIVPFALFGLDQYMAYMIVLSAPLASLVWFCRTYWNVWWVA